MKDELNKVSIFALNGAEWVIFFSRLGQKPYRARQIMTWIYEKGICDPGEMTDFPLSLRSEIKNATVANELILANRQVSVIDKTEKYLWQWQFGNNISTFESVLIHADGRLTACLSSQSGCNVGCTFCATATLGNGKNLPASVIIEQFWKMQYYESGRKIDNIVFMGMGEPFHNYANVIKAAQMFTEHPGFFLHPKRITISTSGIIPRIERYISEKHPFRIAISLNASTDDKRNILIPHNQKWNIQQLLELTPLIRDSSGRRVTIEYVMIRDFNDTFDDAKTLADIIRGYPVKINIIPYNEGGNLMQINGLLTLKAPTDETINKFIQRYLLNIKKENRRKQPLTVRRSAGTDIQGACGQLAAGVAS